MLSTASVALAITGFFPSRLAVTLLVHLDGTIRARTVGLSTFLVHPEVAALLPVIVALAPFVWALALAEVVLAFVVNPWRRRRSGACFNSSNLHCFLARRRVVGELLHDRREGLI